MPFKSLLLSKDTDVVQALTRLLKDLDITVEPCTEPFAAAKRLMDQRFDAILVDCEDEQGAGWVLQSARMAVASKKCITIALVGPHSSGRAKGGENFTIQKPIVLKQAESTLRAARNLMDGGASLNAEMPAPAAAPPSSVPAPAAVVTPPAHANLTAQGRPPAEMFDELTAAVDRLGPQASSARPISAPSPMSSGAAAAPAPAWEKSVAPAPPPVARPEPAPRPAPVLRPQASTPTAAPTAEHGSLLPLAAASEMKSVVRPAPEATPSSASLDEMRRRVLAAPQPAWRTEVERPEPPAPRFSSLASEVEPGRAFPFKAIAVVMVLVSLALFGYSWYRNHHAAPAAASAASQPQAVAPVPQPATEVQSSAPPANVAEPPADQTSAPADEVQSGEAAPSAHVSHSKPAPPAQRAEEAPEASDDSSLPPAPLVVSGGKLESPGRQPQEAAPVAPGLYAVGGSTKPDLGGVVSSTPVRLPQMAAPAPVTPQRIRVSQGVTQGLLVHQVTPQYPAMARETHIEGDVVLEAVIGKDGTVRGLKATSGPPLLVPAALNAVRQWRYKPYLLNGQPVEVETQIKLQFRL